MKENLPLLAQREGFYLKLLFAVQFVAFAFIAPFDSIVFKKALVEADGTPAIAYIGAILTIAPLIGLLANYLVGMLADKLKLGKKILSIISAVAVVAALSLGYVSSPLFIEVSLKVHFLVMFGLVILYKFMTLPLSPLIDSETFNFLNRHSDRKFFGKYRFWGTFGWAFGAPLMGLILTVFQREDGTFPYEYSFYGGALAFLVLAIVATKSHEKAEIKKIEIPWHHLWSDHLFLAFLVFAFLGGVINGSTFVYLGYFFEGVMTSPLQIGLIYGLWTLFEFPIMHFSEKFIRHMGNRWLIILGLVLIAVKLILFSAFTIETPFWQKLLASLVHGPAFALHYLGMVDFVDRHAHKDMRATYMGLLGIARSIIAGFVGGIVGAWVINQWGGAALMASGSMAMLVLAILFILFIRGNGPEEIKKT